MGLELGGRRECNLRGSQGVGSHLNWVQNIQCYLGREGLGFNLASVCLMPWEPWPASSSKSL